MHPSIGMELDVKVVIHAGCAKNGSTAFQTLMARIGPALAAHGVHYPPASLGHRHFAERAYFDDFDWAAEAMDAARSVDAATVVVSSEHFQNILCRKASGLAVATAFRDAGAAEVRFVFSVRDPFDYFEAIYAEAAKWFPISFEQSAQAVLAQGYYWTAWQGTVPVAYVFDYAALFAALRRHLARAGFEVAVDCWELSDFVQGFAGRRLLALSGIGETALAEIEAGLAAGTIAIDRNERLDPDQVELLHAQQFLYGAPVLPGLIAAQSASLEPVADLVGRVAHTKILQIRSQREGLRQRFGERFADWRSCLTRD
ncbi:hypothetical protein [Jiella sonneratiae]|uniref:Sulfotransferase domain-containing protein n=1 Tax=Jiella sonneratiae TaxID=2816856 RepID=A0ABS3IZX4_9HYPH|nr:hypothetical protein [Jiella sonneratiae]MBO0902983.1 hypothetical protein [Jiella sonneratiae]